MKRVITPNPESVSQLKIGRTGRRFFCLAAVLLLPTAVSAATFIASLDRDTIALGESATLSLTFEGGQPRNVPAPDVPGLQIVNTGNSQNFSILNGQMSSTVTVTYSITPQKTGEFVIPALVADIGGHQLATQPLKLTVTQPNAPPPEAINSGSELAFLKFVVPKNEVYVGEIITGELQLYLRDTVQKAGGFQITAMPVDGLNAGEKVEGPQRRVQIGNSIYTVVPFYLPMTVLKAGTLVLGPVAASLVVELPSTGRPERDFLGDFDPFGMFRRREQKQLTLAADVVNVKSLPLPAANVPANFNGAVGNYSMAFTAGPTNVAVGDPITVRVQISGRGALDALTLPDQAAWQGFKTYPPTSKVKTTDQLGLEGIKTFEQIVAPLSTDVRELPPFSFSYFDPDAKAYRTLTEPPVQLAVHSGGTTPAPVLAATRAANEQAPPAPKDILPIKEQLGPLAQVTPPLVTQPVFLAVQGLPVVAFLAALVWRKRADNLAKNPRLRRRRRVAQLVREGLDDLRQLAAENNSDEFFATLFRLLQEQLGERLDCPASSITESVIDERLARLGAPESTLNALRELFQLCNQARYAPLRTSAELAAAIPQFENAVRELQQVNA
jgi:hypothetical protein